MSGQLCRGRFTASLSALRAGLPLARPGTLHADTCGRADPRRAPRRAAAPNAGTRTMAAADFSRGDKLPTRHTAQGAAARAGGGEEATVASFPGQPRLLAW